MDADSIRRKFPIDFPERLLPHGAKEQRIRVYRICRTGHIEPNSFLPTHKDPLFKPRDAEALKAYCGYYSVSTFEDLKEAKRKTKSFKKTTPEQIFAVGFTAPECGPSQRTKDREGENPNTSHVDWWLYDEVTPHIHFEALEKE